MVPVLDIKDFENHLEKKNGVLEPRGRCTASSPWAYLLHALAINPGDNILTWKPASGARWDVSAGGLAMDIRGTAFCHLVNLYNRTWLGEETVQVQGERQERGSCYLSFGWLSWTSTDMGHMIATFEPDTIPKINARKEPLGILGAQLGDASWAAYKAALRDGISDPDMVWPNSKTTPFPERLQCLIMNMKRLQDGRARILTKFWLEHASRIKIRAMSNGGNETTFMEDAYAMLARHPERQNLNPSQCQQTQSGLKRCFFFEEDRFNLRNIEVKDMRTYPMRTWIEPSEILQATLDSYSTADSRSWKGQLYASRDLVLTVALMEKVTIFLQSANTSGGAYVLPFAPGDALWGARVHL